MNELVAELVRLRPWTWTDPDQCEFPFVFDPTLGNEARQVDYPTRVLLGRKFFDLPESTRWATAFHEVGHVLSDMGLVDGWAWDLVDLLPSWGHLNGQTTPGEVAAEAWSIWNTEPSFLLENAPGIAAVMDEVAPAAGFPRVASALPDVDFSVASEPQWGSARCRLSPMRDGRVALSQLTRPAAAPERSGRSPTPSPGAGPVRTLARTEDDEECPKCERGRVVLRRGPHGYFDGCSRFPECEWSDKHRDVSSRNRSHEAPRGSEGDWSIMYNVEESHDFPGEGEMIRGF